MAKIYENLTDLIGNTPLVKLNKLTEGLGATVAVKLESANPGNSVKDRIGRAIIEAAERMAASSPVAPSWRQLPEIPELHSRWLVQLVATRSS